MTSPHTLTTDVLVYGGGLPAMACALWSAEHGLRVLLAGPIEPWHARRLPPGGVALVEDEAALAHRWRPVGGEPRPPSLDWLAAQAPEWPSRLARWGVPFVRSEDRWRRRHAGADEMIHAAGGTGAQLTAAVSMQLRVRMTGPRAVQLLSGVTLRQLVRGPDGCAGAVLHHPSASLAVAAHAVVLAGDSWTPWHDDSAAWLGIESLAAAMRAGVVLRNLDRCDVRPDWLARPHPIALSPAWRAEGAVLWCAPAADAPKAERIRLPEQARDGWDAAQWLVEQASAGAGEQPARQGFIDGRALVASEGIRHLTHEIEACVRSGLPDPRSALLPVSPRLSQLRGGVAVGRQAGDAVAPFACSLAGLFACPGDRSAYSGARGLAGGHPLLSLASAERAAESVATHLSDHKGEPATKPVVAAAKTTEETPPPDLALRTRARKLFRKVARALTPGTGAQPPSSRKLMQLEQTLARKHHGHPLADAALLARAMLVTRVCRGEEQVAVELRHDTDGELHAVLVQTAAPVVAQQEPQREDAAPATTELEPPP